MGSLAALTTAASFSVSEMIGNPLNFSGASRFAPSEPPLRQSAFFKRRNLHPRLSWQPSMSSPSGPEERISSPEGLLDRSEITEYLNGEVTGDSSPAILSAAADSVSFGQLLLQMGGGRKFGLLVVAVTAIGVLALLKIKGSSSWDKEALVEFFKLMSDRLGNWAIPVYVAIHTISLSLCLPYAVFFEAGASLLFGFFPALLCVFSAKVLGASLSFWIGRLLFRSSSSAIEWAQGNKYFHMLSKGVERDGWKFVLLTRFSPIPSYVINYALAATNVRFFRDFFVPTVLGCLPMILQNTSIGSLAGAAVASSTGSQSNKSKIWSYIFPMLGILSSIIISLRIKKYSSSIAIDTPEDKIR